MMKKVFVRKISTEEAAEGYIMVPKNELGYFPPINKSFLLIDEGKHRKTKVESYHCECRGPKKPHEHYFLKKSGLQKWNNVEICKEGEEIFSLKIKQL
jgi:hypothetical protein